jgi:uncharacterized protein YceH (UPF0502 family)
MTAKQDLEAELAHLREENAALRDLLTAAGESPLSPAYVLGYIGGIGLRGNQSAAMLRTHAAKLRGQPDEAEGSES